MQQTVNLDRLDSIVLSWLWCQQGQAVRARALESPLKTIVPAGSATALSVSALQRLVQAGHAALIPAARKAPPAFQITTEGAMRAAQFAGMEQPPASKTPFKTLLDTVIPAAALNLPAPASDLKSRNAFAKLALIAVCARHFSLDVPMETAAAAKLGLVKASLARASGVAVTKIHLKKLPPGELPALIAGPLLGEPETAAANIDKLIEAKAFALLGISKSGQLKSAVVKLWLCDGAHPLVAEVVPALPPATAPARAHEPVAPTVQDLSLFARNVLHAARDAARANPRALSNLGDKILVRPVWEHFTRIFGAMPLDLFKQQLAEANGDHLVLVREDMIPVERAAEFADSEVCRGASSFHYIRIGSLGVTHGA